ncbi:hypothetical protein F383_16682 [Gossypium arboreum]|uniref:Uncharacterized protein n=1 Tax=Gossypium arboreum TaxID=29729 RepID=A0A0B0NM59_GOSAR|nr:hypothetical protein F383_16682 [Gossypium arboreum]
MPLSQTGSYMNQIQHNHISMPTSQTWSYTKNTYLKSYVMTYVS